MGWADNEKLRLAKEAGAQPLATASGPNTQKPLFIQDTKPPTYENLPTYSMEPLVPDDRRYLRALRLVAALLLLILPGTTNDIGHITAAGMLFLGLCCLREL